jgi:hypothetical protein
MSRVRVLRVLPLVSDERQQEAIAEQNARSERIPGKGGLRFIGWAPEAADWTAMVNALVERDFLPYVNSATAIRAEWIKGLRCPAHGGGSGSFFMRRDKVDHRYEAGTIRYQCGQGCGRQILEALGIERATESRQSASVASVASAASVTESGYEVLADVRGWLARFLSVMQDEDLDLLALWVVHTHVVVECYTTVRLLVDSPVPGSGKTTVLEHLQRLCVDPVLAASLSSPALLARMLDAGMRTILIDEVDRSLDPKREGTPDLLAVLNSGYKRGATRPVLVPAKGNEWAVKEMSTFSPVAMAGNTPSLPDDTRSRSVRVLMMPDIAGEVEDSDWELIEEEAAQLKRRIEEWADQVRDTVAGSQPELPEECRGRAKERWRPLARVALAAGGDWPERVSKLAVMDMAEVQAAIVDGEITEKPHAVLLRHLSEVWPVGESFAPTALLLDRLSSHADDVWGRGSPFGNPITAQRLGRMLSKGYRVHSVQPNRGGPRGYSVGGLRPAWRRGGITPPSVADAADAADATDAQPAHPLCRTCSIQLGTADQAAGTGLCGTCELNAEVA